MTNDTIKYQGFTLIELMIALVLGLIILLAAFTVYHSYSKGSASQHELLAIEEDIENAMDIIELDIRNAGCNPKQSGFHAFTDLNDVDQDNTLTINFDINDPPCGSKACDTGCSCSKNKCLGNTCAGNIVKYSRNSSKQLIREESKAGGSDFEIPHVLVNNVDSFTYTYTTGDCCAALDIEDRVNTVSIKIKVVSPKKDTETGNPIETTLNRTVNVRNYGRNK